MSDFIDYYRPTLWRSAAGIFRKDLLIESRGRVAVNTVLLFSITTLTLVSLSTTISLREEFQAALLWVVIFFSAMTGLSRSFVHEEDSGTADALRMAASSEAVFVGKFAFNLFLLIAVQSIVVPLSIVFWQVHPSSPALLIGMLLAGDAGLAAVATLMAAIVARTKGHSALFTVLSLPILIPLLSSVVEGTLLSLQPDVDPRNILRPLHTTLMFGVIMFTVGYLAFGHVWRE